MAVPSPASERLRTLIAICAAIAALVGVAVLAGWALDIELLKSVVPGLSTMKANTAVCLALLGAALWLATQSGVVAGRASTVLSAIATVIACLTLLQYALGLDLLIDQLLFAASAEAGRTLPGRMAPLTALAIALLGVAIPLTRLDTVVSNIASIVLSLSAVVGPTLAVVGYFYGIQELYAPGPFTSMAVHTALVLIVLFFGVSLLRADLGWVALLRSQGPGGAIARRLLPTVILLPIVLGWAGLQGELAGYYGLPTGVALLALSSAAILSAVSWWSARRVDQLDRARRRQAELNRTILETALDAIVLMDSSGRIVEWNPQAAHIFRLPRDLAIGRTVAEAIIPHAQRSAHAKGLAHVLATGEGPILNKRNKLRALRGDGTEFPVELVVTPVHLDHQTLFSGFIRDLSEQEQAEIQLRQAQKMEAVGQLTGGIAHDFNNLLTVVIGSLEAAILRPGADSITQLKMALDASERGAKLVEHLLAISRRQTLVVGAIDLNELCSGVDHLLRSALGEHIEIEMRLAPDLWPAFADKGRVQDALLNLAVNARDAMPSGGKLTIETGNANLDEDYARRNVDVAPGEYTMLAVTDTGVGMAADVIERAFEPFFTTKDVGKGSGLGLSMVYGFAKQSRGHLKIYSEVGQGTTVRLYLPRATKVEAHVPPPAVPQSAPRGGETILLVEDDASVRSFAVGQLTDLGYRVIEAADGQQARKVLSGDAHIDLLFTDVVMPGGLNGRELAVEAKRQRPNLVVLFTSGYTENAIVHQGRLDPDVHFLPKPYRRAELAQKVRAALDASA